MFADIDDKTAFIGIFPVCTLLDQFATVLPESRKKRPETRDFDSFGNSNANGNRTVGARRESPFQGNRVWRA